MTFTIGFCLGVAVAGLAILSNLLTFLPVRRERDRLKKDLKASQTLADALGRRIEIMTTMRRPGPTGIRDWELN